MRRLFGGIACAAACVWGGACGAAPAAPPADAGAADPDDVFCDPLDQADDDTSPPAPTPEPLVRWVDPRIGTGGVAWGVGTTYPGAQAPFGMARPSPDTSHLGAAADFMHCSGYSWGDDVIDGFSQFHLHGVGVPDYGGMALMPTIGVTAAKTAPRGHGSPFSHAAETASPGYYAVTLSDTHVKVELTASARVAFHRVTFPANVDGVVLVDAAHVLADGETIMDASVEVDPAAREVRGYSHVLGGLGRGFGGVRLFFVARFDAPFAASGTYAGGALADGSTSAQGKDAGAYVHFAQPIVTARVGVSFVDVAHAKMNLDAEDAPFDAVRQATEAAWEKRLGRVRVEARSDRDRRIFTTALYHTQLMPALASDTDGSYRGVDGQVHTSPQPYFSDFSLWDTYRTLMPWLALVYPEDASLFAASLALMGRDAGSFPRWPLGPGESGSMIGDPAFIALADAAVKGIGGWDSAGAYAIAKTQATVPGPKARDHLEDWLALGYYPDEDGGGSVSRTLEYAAADDALGSWAATLGNAADAAALHARAKRAYTALWDPAAYFFVPKRKDGSTAPYNPQSIGGPYTEGSAWQYSFMLPFDAAALASLMTQPVLLHRLEQLFTRAACTGKAPFLPQPYYWPANEPDLFSGWLFGALGDRDRAGRWLRWTTVTHYGDGPDGLPGNDDSGTMSAFYLFASLGFYPIPASPAYVLGAPLHPRATLALPSGTLTVDAPAATRKTRYVASVARNGAPAGAAIAHGDLPGATLRFELHP